MRRALCPPLALALLALPVLGQQPWNRFGIDEADRAAPCLVGWQRSLEDAEALSRASGRPLLICVNMDGEAASEVFAHRKYKDEAFAALTRGFVPIVLSPTRHNPLDHDARGRRIPCPRFGGVTCGEHIDPEPAVYARYFAGERYAPRHVGVSPAGEVLFDRYLDQDLGRVDEALRQHGLPVASERWAELLDSPAAEDRERLERAYLEGPRSLRAELLGLAAGSSARPFELLRLGLAEEDAGLRAQACQALARTADASAVPLLVETLRRELGRAERQALFEALERLAADDPLARRELRVQAALNQGSAALDVEVWRRILATAEAPPPAPDPPTEEELYARIDALGAELRTRPGDPRILLDLAEQSLAAGRLMIDLGRDPSLFLTDAVDLARRAAEALADPLETSAVRARAEWLLANVEVAAAEATRALELATEAPLARAAAEALDVLARARTAQIYRADGAQEEWRPEWLADALAAYEVLLLHPRGDAAQAISYVDLLAWLALDEREGRAHAAALARFPADPDAHQRFRAWVERTRGLQELEPAYAQLLARDGASAVLRWYAGYAELVVAEARQRGGAAAEAHATYARAIELMDAALAAEPTWQESTDHFVALALAGQAWISLRSGDRARALDELLAALRRRPDSAESPDGNERTPAGTLRLLRSELRRAGEEQLSARLEAEVGALRPDLLAEPAEPAGPGDPPRGGGGR